VQGAENMRGIVACECSGRVRNAFRKLGHDFMSCDLQQTETPGPHFQGDIYELLDEGSRANKIYDPHAQGWDILIAHPDCRYMANSGARWLFEKHGRFELLNKAAEFFNYLKDFTKIPKRCIENPMPHKWATELIGKYTQKIQPWQFGEQQKKGTCLWLINLPPLLPTTAGNYPPSDKGEAKKWEAVWREAPGPEQRKNRARTFNGIANAMANQWG
jgi:hypothetical protein